LGARGHTRDIPDRDAARCRRTRELYQTLTGLKGGTIYLVEARVLPTTDVVKLTTTDAAAGTFTNLALSSSSGTAAWETLAGIILTDATPNVTVNLLSDATDYDFGVAYVSVREVASTANTHTNEHEGTNTRGGNMIRYLEDQTTVTWAALPGATKLSVVVPGDGYIIEVDGSVHISANSHVGNVSIYENIDGGGSNLVSSFTFSQGQNDLSDRAVSYTRMTCTPGSVYEYTLNGTTTAGTPAVSVGNKRWHRLRVRMTKT
jgi:hypothetical protein